MPRVPPNRAIFFNSSGQLESPLKGKRALTVADTAALPEVINTILAAVKAGELDAPIATVIAANKSKSVRT